MLIALSARTLGVISFGSLFASIFLLLAPYSLFPEAYVPKINPSSGYSSPNTGEAWIVLGVALILLVVSLLGFMFLAAKLKSAGSIWVTSIPWSTWEAISGLKKRVFKMAAAANTIVVSAFLGALSLTRSTPWGNELTVASLIIFNILIVSANLSIFLYYRKKQTTK